MTVIPTEEFTLPTSRPLAAMLPDEFWTARPKLAHIRQAAWARLIAPDALLGAILCRVAAISPHTIEIPAIIATPVGLTFFALLVGPPEAGKSAAAHVAADLLPAPDNVLDLQPIGSGEGLVEALFVYVETTNDKGKTVKVKRQVRHGLILHVDEGAVLADLGSRSGSTLMSTLRSAWTSGPLGNLNASIERRRILRGGTYVYGVTVGMQPEAAGPLLGDVNLGGPQRFLWTSATDPATPSDESEWPGQLPWEPPDLERFQRDHARAGWVRHPLLVHRTIVEEVRQHRLATVRGELCTDIVDSHRNLLRLKVAGLLAILDGRSNVNDDDWHLAAIVGVTSRSVRMAVQATLAGVEQHKETAFADRTARREIRVEDTKTDRAMASACRSVAGIVARHAERDEHKNQGGGCTRRCLTNAVAGKHRELVAIDDVIELAERNGWIAVSDDRWIVGESRPA